MKAFLSKFQFTKTLMNIFSIKELRERIFYTLALLLLFRFGSYVVLPGVDPTVLKSATDGTGGGLLGLINAFTGGAFNQAAIFALGIMPYISASIIIQLLGFAVPYFQRLQQKEGESGRKKITQITRMLTIAITLVQGAGYLTYIQSSFPGAVVAESKPLFYATSIIILSAGTIFSMWLGERITEKGIGNGVSLLITVGIIASLPTALVAEFGARFSAGAVGGPLVFVIEMIALLLVIAATVLLVRGVRRIPIQYAKRSIGRGQGEMPGKTKRDYIPLKVNAAGVMPIIFAQALMFVPATIAQFVNPTMVLGSDTLLGQMNDYKSLPYNVIYFVLVVLFTYVYTALMVNPQQHAEYLKQNNAFIPGIKPGEKTAEFIDTVTSRITLPGSIFLGLISILPAFAAHLFGANDAFALFFGGTSLLIMVGVVLDTLEQIETHLVMRRYDGLVKSGRLKRKGGVMDIGASM